MYGAGIATRYGLDGPGIELQWGRNFSHLCRPVLGPSHPPLQWVPGLSHEEKQQKRGVDHSLPSNAEVKERSELYLWSPSGPLWSVLG